MSVKEPLAIVGMGCRFPGAKNLSAYWQLLRNGVDAITETPRERFDIDAFYDPSPGSAGKLITRWGGFLADIDQFDPAFFGISPREASCMDPQQRLLLEVAWEALEDAGIAADTLAGTATGVFVGMSTNDYEDLAFQQRDAIDLYMMTGCSRGVTSGRLSYALNLQGPSLTVDTACSSSLVAVHLACQSVWNGESQLAFAGGTNLILGPEQGLGFSRMGLLSPDGRCKTFDERADGFVRSEGVGVVLIKPLAQALTDHDPIYCLIRGSAVNNDGRSSGFLVTPGLPTQEDVLRQAYRDAHISPQRVQYIETHGTGTTVGDRVEISAIGAVCGDGRSDDNPCLIGSVKTNIGHTEGASGIAGLIKVALSLKHDEIPAHLHFQKTQPQLSLSALHLQVPVQASSWVHDTGPVYAGVSSFGISATNSHVVLEQVPALSQKPPAAVTAGTAHLFTLSAKTPEALRALAQAYQLDMNTHSEAANPTLEDLCYTANCRRTQHKHRLALVVETKSEIAENLEAFLQQEVRRTLVAGSVPLKPAKVVYVFPGQGAQWLGMGRELFQQQATFRTVILQCAEKLPHYVDWSLLDVLLADDSAAFLDRIDVIQPVLFVIELALAALWSSWGVKPDAVVGHSMGELAAAVFSNGLSLDDGLRVICVRSQLLRDIRGQGSMAVVGLPLAEAQRVVASAEGLVAVAASNGPRTSVLSGESASIERICHQLQKQEIYTSLVRVDVASHSPQVDGLLTALVESLAVLQPQSATTPFYSTVTGEQATDKQFDAHYWSQNVRQPVLFYATIQQLINDGYDTFIEMSPHPILMNAIQETLQTMQQEGLVLPSLRRNMPEMSVLLATVGALYTRGVSLTWSAFSAETAEYTPLPSYPWQHEHFWLQQMTGVATATSTLGSFSPQQKTFGAYPIIGSYGTSAAHPGDYIWDFEVSREKFAYLSDHCLQESVVFPATAYIEAVLEATKQLPNPVSYVLEQISFQKALFLPEQGGQRLQLIVSTAVPGTISFHFFRLQTDATASWELHAHGTLVREREQPEASTALATNWTNFQQKQATDWQVMDGVQHYQAMQARGLQYGPSFQGVGQVWSREGEAWCQITSVASIQANIDIYQFHPALFDACLQAVLVALPGSVQAHYAGPIIPVRVEQLHVYRPCHSVRWSHARFLPLKSGSGQQFALAWELFDADGQLVLTAQQVSVQPLALETALDKDSIKAGEWCYEIQWEEGGSRPDADGQAAGFAEPGTWLLFADGLGVSAHLQKSLRAMGEQVVLVSVGQEYREVSYLERYEVNPLQPDDFVQLLTRCTSADLPPYRGIVHLWSLQAPNTTQYPSLSMLKEQTVRSCGSTLHLLQALADVTWTQLPRLWLFTNGVQLPTARESAPLLLAQAPLWGIGKTCMYEHPELHCTLVDVSAEPTAVEAQTVAYLLGQHVPEQQIALREKRWYVARLMQGDPGVAKETAEAIPLIAGHDLPASNRPFRLEIPVPGRLEALQLSQGQRIPPGYGEVEIEVQMAGLNFKDVMFALGMLEYENGGELHFGHECAGIVVRCGEGVLDFHEGDEVIATIAPSCFRRYLLRPVERIVHKPRFMSTVEAATMPLVFLTAYYALVYIGRLTKGERVLIHAGAGGVGLAAIQIAQHLGAEIFVTAGSPEKREYVRSLGIAHVMDSRTLAFADEIMEITRGQGVDVVLNSLAGEALSKSLSLLSNHGRFLELGKRDIHSHSHMDLTPFERNLSFAAIDISLLLRERPQLMMRMLREILQHFEEGTFRPLPTQTFAVADAVEAFRWMAQAKHIGKIALSFEPEAGVSVPAAETLLRPDATYLITGGLGGLGVTLARWMVEQGARHLVLVGRHGASAALQSTLAQISSGGAEIRVVQADMTEEQDVVRLLRGIKETGIPLRGLVHAAGILKDSILLRTDVARLQEVLAPKMDGAWYLHTLTAGLPLDFFVLFSSTASLIGLPGQGNYAAANAFLDGLAQLRHQQGLPALSIQWGVWAEVGLAAAQTNRGDRLADRGLKALVPQQGLAMLAQLLQSNKDQCGALFFDPEHWQQCYPGLRSASLFARLLGSAAQPEHSSGRTLSMGKQSLQERRQFVQKELCEQMGQILKVSVEKVDREKELSAMGLDSLMAVELKNRIAGRLGVSVPVVRLLQGISIVDLATWIVEVWSGHGEGAVGGVRF